MRKGEIEEASMEFTRNIFGCKFKDAANMLKTWKEDKVLEQLSTAISAYAKLDLLPYSRYQFLEYLLLNEEPLLFYAIETLQFDPHSSSGIRTLLDCAKYSGKQELIDYFKEKGIRETLPIAQAMIASDGSSETEEGLKAIFDAVMAEYESKGNDPMIFIDAISFCFNGENLANNIAQEMQENREYSTEFINSRNLRVKDRLNEKVAKFIIESMPKTVSLESVSSLLNGMDLVGASMIYGQADCLEALLIKGAKLPKKIEGLKLGFYLPKFSGAVKDVISLYRPGETAMIAAGEEDSDGYSEGSGYDGGMSGEEGWVHSVSLTGDTSGDYESYAH